MILSEALPRISPEEEKVVMEDAVCVWLKIEGSQGLKVIPQHVTGFTLVDTINLSKETRKRIPLPPSWEILWETLDDAIGIALKGVR